MGDRVHVEDPASCRRILSVFILAAGGRLFLCRCQHAVQRCRRPFGKAAVVHEDQRRGVRLYAGKEFGEHERPRTIAGQLGEIGDGAYDAKVHAFLLPRVDDGDGTWKKGVSLSLEAAEE